MKVKEGDKLICYKPKRSFFRKDHEPFFTNGNVYEVDKIFLGNPNTGQPFETLVIYDDLHHLRFLNYDEISPDCPLGKIFINIKELRKRKLKKLKDNIVIQ